MDSVESRKEVKSEKIVVAMSGGVDSAAAAALLQEQGFDVVGVSMQVWDYRKNGGNATRATCCAPADFDDARDVAERCGFPFYVFDFEDSFYDSVISPFVQSYLNGKTPNPCLDCNRKVKFRELRSRARTLGAKQVATGHYAQIKELEGGQLGLFTSVDKEKDQSYFLYAMTQQDLAETLFPVGHMVKDEVRQYLQERELEVASKAESQDICFVSSSVPKFIEKESGVKPEQGQIVSTQGETLGVHDGIHGFTVGQRKGLGVAHEHPLYVLSVDSDSKQVTVGGKEELKQEGFVVEDVNWISGEAPQGSVTARVKLRYRHPGVLCELSSSSLSSSNRAVTGKFLSEWTSVSPGQAAVFYAAEEDEEGDRQVLGGGIIASSI